MQSPLPNMYRIATWNLDRPTKNRISQRAARLTRIADQAAQLWVLTETDRNLVIDGFRSVATERSSLSSYGDQEAAAAIHYEDSLDAVAVPTFDSRTAVCARFDASPMRPFIAYGSIRRQFA